MLSRAGLGSRSDARGWIGEGRVTVNGEKIRSPDHWVDPARDRVAVDGRPLRESKKVYLLLYKPKGYITTYRDPQGRPTVYDLLVRVSEWVFPVGRLDLDTSGLLLMTNDTAWADAITDPMREVPKTYLVKTSPVLDDESLDRLRAGPQLDDGPARPAKVERLRNSASGSFLSITITEGRNRQVRRMIEAVGGKVRKLVRTSIGPIEIGELQIGSYRALTHAEIELLRRSAGMRRQSRPAPERG